MGDIQTGENVLSEQERIEMCYKEIVAILEKYQLDLYAIPRSRTEGKIIIVEAQPQLTVRSR